MSGKKASAASNAAYQTLYQVLTLITPLITAPYIARVLMANNIGIFTYTYSIVTYFQLIAMLGVVNYGTRTIAQCNKDRKCLSSEFSNIYYVQVISSVIAILGYVLYILIVYKTNAQIDKTEMYVALLQSFWLFSALFDINWFFFGIEAFKITVTRNIIIKILTVASIFIFVQKGQHPVLVYTAIMAGGNLISSAVIWPVLKRYVDFTKPDFREMKQHLKPNLILFVPLLAMSVFHTMDKTMLGVLAPGADMGIKNDLGYYYNADKLVHMPLGIIDGFGTVFLPQATQYFSSGSKKEGISFLHKTHELNICVTSLLAFGIAGCAKEFIPIFFGKGFEPCILLCYIFVPVMIVKASSTFLRMQYLVPAHKEKIFTIATICGACVNLIANSILIPDKLFGLNMAGLGAVGAVIGTLIAESVVMLVQFYMCIGDLPLRKWSKDFMIYLLIGSMMLVIMRFAALLDLNGFLLVIVEIAVGGLSFCALCFPLWYFTDRREWAKYFLNMILKKRSV